ncbi:hypothetical protein DUI87_33478 [Hirundo rustica rustica]|uniref:SAM domain-containing protein n=1 Tax=Hirundo rustica rustica TaxID=333673 RepID=A0A3M0IP54_HIRRU|nr:hypothetical protein DUI87_33478 [Hirundo rustica rustica]
MMFRDQVGIVAGWFRGWSECEQTVALLALLKRVTRTQARFLQLCLEHSLADCPDIHLLEAEANSAAAISQWPQEPAEAAVALLLAHLPLLQPGNAAAKAEYMKRLQKVLADAIESNRPVKRSLALVPGSPQPGPGGDWAGSGGPEEPPAAPRGPPPPFGDHAPLSPQSSVASSGSEHTEEPGGRNSFQEDGSGMKDVPLWLKSLRLHKYAALFAQMSYEEMMTLTEHHLESQNVTKGARHKIALSIQKLRERQSVLRALEKDILEGGNLWTALQELQQILVTPIKAFRPPPAAPPPPGPPTGPPLTPRPPRRPSPTGTSRDSSRVSWARLLVSRPDEENITSYLQLLEKCLSHEAFTETQKKRLQSWKQQVLKLLRAFPKKGPLDGPPGYRPPKRVRPKRGGGSKNGEGGSKNGEGE